MARLWFVTPLRCLDCKTRSVMQTVILRDLLYARCPCCYRMDLNGWTGKTYEPPLWMKLKILFGANRWRCEYCRMNFADFRKRKEIFSFKRWERMNAGQARREGRERVAELQAQYAKAAAGSSQELVAPTEMNLDAGELEDEQ